MKSYKTSISLGGGGAAASSSPTFLSFEEIDIDTAHLAKPKDAILKFALKSQTDMPPSNLDYQIKCKVGMFDVTLDIERKKNSIVANLHFKTPDELERSKGLLKTLEVLFTDKGKTSTRRPEFSVVQSKKGERIEDLEKDLEEFPIAVLGGNYHLKSMEPMNKNVHMFLNKDIKNTLQSWSLDGYARIIKLPMYKPKYSDGNGIIDYCIPHPNNPNAQSTIVDMQQSSTNQKDPNFNWTHEGYIFVPQQILAIKEYWSDNRYGVSCLPAESGPISLSGSISSLSKTIFPKFNPEQFLERLGLIEPILPVLGPRFENFFLKPSVISMIFNFDSNGRLTENPNKVRWAQMIPALAFQRNANIFSDHKTSLLVPGYKTQFELANILIVCPGKSFKSPDGLRFRSDTRENLYLAPVKVLIPHEFYLNMPEVWVQLERLDYIISGDQ
jgi:hypothetical protein